MPDENLRKFQRAARSSQHQRDGHHPGRRRCLISPASRVTFADGLSSQIDKRPPTEQSTSAGAGASQATSSFGRSSRVDSMLAQWLSLKFECCGFDACCYAITTSRNACDRLGSTSNDAEV